MISFPFRIVLSFFSVVCFSNGPPPPPSPDYVSHAKFYIDGIDAKWPDLFPRLCYRRDVPIVCNDAASLSSAHAAWWRHSGNASYATSASNLLHIFLASYRNVTFNGTVSSGDETDFFACAPAAFAALALKDAGAFATWDPSDVAMLRDHALMDVCQPQMRGTWNQAASRASGTTLYLHAFPEVSASRPDFGAYVDTVIGDWLAEHAYPENAPGYNSVYFMELLRLFALRNASAAAADLCSPPTARMLEHFFVDLVGPTGALLSFGDDWNGVGGSTFPNEIWWGNSELAFWTAPLEQYATACRDGRARWTAAAVFAHVVASDATSLNLADVVHTSKAAVTLLQAAAASDPTLAPQYVGDGGGLTTRALPGAPAVIDKLTLFSSRAPCGNSTFAAVELLAGPNSLYHAHAQQVGAMLYYSAGGVTFLRNLGRDNRLPETSAGQMIFWRNLSGTAHFPFRSPVDIVVPGGPWQLAEFATAHLAPTSQAPADYYTRNVTGFNIHFDNTASHNTTVFIGCLSLYNASTGEVRVVDAFDPSKMDYTWGRAVSDANLPCGTHALALDVAPGVGNTTRPQSAALPLPGIFDARDWTHFFLYWRFSPDAELGNADSFGVGFGPFIDVESVPPGGFLEAGSTFDFTSDGVGVAGAPYPAPKPNPTNISFTAVDMLAPSFTAAVRGADAVVNTTTNDAVGAFSLSAYFSHAGAWNRSLVAFHEGPLIVVDSVVGTAEAAAWSFGPNFMFDVAPNISEDVSSSGAPFFTLTGFNNTGCYGYSAGVSVTSKLVLAFALFAGDTPAAFTASSQRTAVVGNVFPIAVYARAQDALGAAPSHTFVTVFLPADVSVPSADLASGINITVRGGGAIVTLPLPTLGGGAPKQDAIVSFTEGAGPDGVRQITIERCERRKC